MKKLISIIIVLAFTLSCAAVFSPQDVKMLLNDIKGSQEKIKDMQADVQINVTAKILIEGKETTQKQTSKGRIYSKRPNKFRLETTSPMEQTTIMNGDKMALINKTTGQKMVQDLKKLREQSGLTQGEEMDITKSMERFDLKITNKTDKEIVLTGTPKEPNKFLGKMVFVLDAKNRVPIRITAYNPNGGLISYSTLQYKNISGINVLEKNVTEVTSPYGSSKSGTEFKNIKINQGLSDKLFEIE